MPDIRSWQPKGAVLHPRSVTSLVQVPCARLPEQRFIGAPAGDSESLQPRCLSCSCNWSLCRTAATLRNGKLAIRGRHVFSVQRCHFCPTLKTSFNCKTSRMTTGVPVLHIRRVVQPTKKLKPVRLRTRATQAHDTKKPIQCYRALMPHVCVQSATDSSTRARCGVQALATAQNHALCRTTSALD